MNIPASILIEKMEEELKKLKVAIEDESSYHEQATVIKAYCDLLLSSSKSTGMTTPKVKHATVEDVTGKKSHSVIDEMERLTDNDDEEESGSLLDF